jgi:hypothetical protein
MSREDVAAIRAVYERAAGSHDRYAATELLSEDFTLRDRTLPEFPEEIVGIAAYKAYIDHVVASFRDVRYDVEETRDLGDRVLLKIHATGEGRDGIKLQGHMGHLWKFLGGRAIRADIYGTWPEALEAAGLRE